MEARLISVFFFHGDVPRTRHKYWELQLDAGWFPPHFNFFVKLSLDKDMFYAGFSIFGIVEFNLRLNRRADHAGFMIDFHTLFGFLTATIYDTRHWNDDEDRWMISGESLEAKK